MQVEMFESVAYEIHNEHEIQRKRERERKCSELVRVNNKKCEISSSHGGEYDVQSCLLGYTAV
jgi:hypothetical protein